MLQASAQQPTAGPHAGLWAPGMSPLGLHDEASARAREIARKREEMLEMLHDLPESEYELSFTDLVDKSGAAAGANGGTADPPPPTPTPADGKEATSPPLPPAGRSASGRQAEQPAAASRSDKKGSSRRRDGGGSFRSSSDGVLLNFYMPRSISRSFTTPRAGRTPSVSAGGRTASVISEDSNKRERDGDTVKCWSLLWDRRWRKSSRRDPNAPPSESTVFAASLKGAKHTAHPAKV